MRTAPGRLWAAAEQLLAAPSGDRELGVHPESGRTIVAKSGRYGPYVTEVLGEEPAPMLAVVVGGPPAVESRFEAL